MIVKPVCLDLFCCGGGASRGYDMAGYEVYGIDNDPKRLRDYPYPFLVMDAIEAMVQLKSGEGLTFSDGRILYLKDIALIHASPPCQGYSIMNNLPWIRSRTYPLLILPCRELLETMDVLYVIENVAGAASKKNLEKLGLLGHRLRAFWLCGGMFGLSIYRHRYFETNFFWPMPAHPKHVRTKQAESSFSPRPRGASMAMPVVETRRRSHISEKLPGMHGKDETEYKGSWDRYKRTSPMGSAMGKAGLEERTRSSLLAGYLETTANPIGHSGGKGAQKEGVAGGNAAGWRIAAEAMGIDWMRHSELTQAIPPAMTAYIGSWALRSEL